MNKEPESNLGQEIPTAAPVHRAIVMQRVQERDEATSRDCIPRRDPQRSARLSFGQERLWFLSAMEPESRAYHLGKAYHLRGLLDVEALEKSIEEILRRHETLRTRFASQDGNLVQVVVPHRPFRLPACDLTGVPRSERLEEALRWGEREVSCPFDLTAGPLMRTTLLRLDELEYIVVFTFHHIIFDGWSGGVFARELGAFYNAFRQGRRPDWPDLPIQYADYAAWQRLRYSDEWLEPHLAFWRKHLADASPSSLLTDHPRPARLSSEGGRYFFALPEELAQKLERFNRGEKVTPFMTLFAAFAVLLYRWSGQTDIVVGTPVANRLDVEAEGLIGFFVNTVVIRVNLEDEASFREVVRRVRGVALDAFQYQDLPFEKLVEGLNPPRDASRHPLFQVAFALQNANEESLTLPGIEVSRQFLRSAVSRFDLELHLLRDGDGWLGVLAYARELFDDMSMAMRARQYVVLLDALLTGSDRPVSLVPMMPEVERDRMVAEWNQTSTKYPRDRGIHELFGEQARRRPEAVAVVFGEERLTYRELAVRSSGLASYLQSLGMAGRSVAILMEPSVEMIVGLLGILKAGAAYVPIDPEYPKERIDFMLRDSGAEVVLTQERLLERYRGDGLKKICLKRGWESRERVAEMGSAESLVTGGSAVAYVMYTSGSTGMPKGVCVPHRAVSRLVINSDYVRFGEDDVVAQISNCGFDAATFEIWGALLNGSRLVGIERARVLSAERLAEELARHGVTTIFVTTSLFNELVRERPTIFSEVGNVLFGGEECDPGTVRKVLECGGHPRRLLHVYGPTETTTFATWYEIKPGQNHAGKIPIGRPIANTRIYILDGHLNPVPIGVPGEIWIGGEGVANGYLGRPELTAERFVSSPFVPGESLYRTGDRGRFRADGNIEFLGRLDNQVKIRGFRIELGEIEAALLAHPNIRHAAVCVREWSDTGEDRLLVAYVVMADGRIPARLNSELRAFLKRKVPDHMVPAAFIILEKLPLSPTGKIDRRALPAPVFDHERPGFIAPRNDTEKMVAQAWSTIINVENIGVHEDFFELGGHSLLAMRVVSKLRAASGTDIPLRVFFENATVEAIAEYIEGARWTAVCARLAPAGADREELVI